MQLSNTNKFGILKTPKFGVFLSRGFPLPSPLSIDDSYNSLRFYMNKAG